MEKKLKAKIKVSTNVYNDKMPRDGSECICLSMVFIDTVFKMGKNYYLQVQLEECKYIVKEKEVTRHITKDLEFSSNYDSETDKE